MKAQRPSLALLAFPLLFSLAGCGKEACRVPFTAEGAGKTSAALKAGDVAFWTDIDIEWEGDGALEYKVDLAQAGTTVATATCAPLVRLTTRIAWVETNIGSSHSRRGSGLMGCKASLPSGGPTDVTTTLTFVRRPAKVTLRKADLVVKQ